MKRSALKPSTKPMSRGTPMARGKPMKVRRKARPKIEGIDYLAMCRGQNCFLSIPGICRNNVETVVPAHRNQGKGMGLKVSDQLTVPACMECHYWYDQGPALREEKRAAFDAAYLRWDSCREKQFNQGV